MFSFVYLGFTVLRSEGVKDAWRLGWFSLVLLEHQGKGDEGSEAAKSG